MKPASKPTSKFKATSTEEGAIDRANRAQAMESAEMKKTMPKKPAGKKPMPKKPAGKKPMLKYAKGGSIDGVAKKGKTHTKMVKMAGGGSCGMKKGK